MARNTPTPLSKTKVAAMEANGEKVWRLRDGTAYASRAERRAARVARKEQQ